MNKITNYLVNNNCYKTNKRRASTLGVMVHSTATPGVSATQFAERWNTPTPGGKQVCVHAFVDDKNLVYTLPLEVRCWGCGKGNKGSGNDTYIQIEMCENSDIYYTDGWKYNSKNTENTKQYINNTVNNLIEFIVKTLRYLGIDEVNETTVTSHYEGYKQGIASNHGDPAGFLGLANLTMNDIREKVKNKMKNNLTSITGESKCTYQQMYNYLYNINKEVKDLDKIINSYLKYGEAERIRGDIAFAQACLETGNFTFKDTAVKYEQYNFCGMGVTKKGLTGNSFDSIEQGVLAQIQHLKAYANTQDLKLACADPRFNFVKRGCAEYIEWLGQQENPNHLGWAAGANYGEKILNILNKMIVLQSDTSQDKSENKDTTDNKCTCGCDCCSKQDEPYLVKVTASVLNIREKPSANSTKKGKITDRGTYTIIETQGNWGKLKSGAGWICLDYTERK